MQFVPSNDVADNTETTPFSRMVYLLTEQSYYCFTKLCVFKNLAFC